MDNQTVGLNSLKAILKQKPFAADLVYLDCEFCSQASQALD